MTFKEVAITLETHAQTQPPEIAEALQMAVELCRDRAAKEDVMGTLKKGDHIWYADFARKKTEEAEIVSVYFKDEEIDSFSVDFADGNYDEFVIEALGDCIFKSREDAEAALQCGY